jgi:hypothetical protein
MRVATTRAKASFAVRLWNVPIGVKSPRLTFIRDRAPRNIGRGRSVVGPQHPARPASRFMRVLESTARNLALEIDDPFAFSLSYRAALHSNRDEFICQIQSSRLEVDFSNLKSILEALLPTKSQ